MTTLFKENCLLEKQQLIKEGNKVKVKGIFQRADVPNKNRRVYTRELWEKVLKRNDVLEAIKGRNMLGELDHPDITETSLKNVSHLVTNLEMTPSGEIIGEAEILDTPNGLILKKLIEAEVKVGISSRGYVADNTKPKTDKHGNMIVPESFQLKTFDFVVDPSTPGAFPEVISESTKAEIMTLIETFEVSGEISPQLKAVCESLNTREGGSRGMENQELLNKIATLESTISTLNNTITGLEQSYQTVYRENADLKQAVESGEVVSLEDHLVVVTQLEEAKEIMAELVGEVAHLEERLEEATDIVEEVTNELQEAANAQVELEESYAQQQDVAVKVIEGLRDRYLVAESHLDEALNRGDYLENKNDELYKIVEGYEDKEAIESLILEQSKALRVGEGTLRTIVEGCSTVQEAKDAILAQNGKIARNRATLPSGKVNESAQQTQQMPLTTTSRLAKAIARVR